MALADRQHGVVSRAQLRDSGLSDKQIESWLERAWLYSLHPSVYAVGRRKLRGDGRLMAAVLASGQGAVLSHRSAGHVWGIRRSAAARVEVTVPRSRRGIAGVKTYRTRSLPPQDATVHDGFPVTSVARTLVDLAAVLPTRGLARALEEAERLGLFHLGAISDSCGRGNGRRGVRALRRLLANYEEQPFTRSELERLFRRRCRQHGVPLPSFNVNLYGYEVDALWEKERLIAELDGWEYHRTRAAFERDRERDAVLTALGYRVLRFTTQQVRGEAAWSRLRAALLRP